MAYIIITIIKQNRNQFVLVVKATALKQQLSCSSANSTHSGYISDHICVSQWPITKCKS